MAEITITASPRQRWALALLLFSAELKFQGRREQKRLYRARRDLGLLEPSQTFMIFNQNQAPGSRIQIGPGAQDHVTRHAFRLTEESLEFFLEVIEKGPIGQGDLIWLEPLLQAIEERKSEGNDAPAYDAAEDAERWKPLAEPAPAPGDEPAAAPSPRPQTATVPSA